MLRVGVFLLLICAAGCRVNVPFAELDVTQFEKIECHSGYPAFDQLGTPEKWDSVQLHREESIVAKVGERCSHALDKTGCEMQITKRRAIPLGTTFIASTTALTFEGAENESRFFFTSVRGDEVRAWQTGAELKNFFGAIDSKQEAVWVAIANGFSVSCDEKNNGAVKKNDDKTFDVVATKGIDCELTWQVKIRVNEDGRANIIDYVQTGGGCIL